MSPWDCATSPCSNGKVQSHGASRSPRANRPAAAGNAFPAIAPRPARVGCKDYARTALDMDTAGAVDYARSIHAVINSSAEMVRKS